MNLKTIRKNISNLKRILKFSVNDDVKICIGGYSFNVDSIDFFNGIELATKTKFPINTYRFTFLMFDPKTNVYKGITHRTYRAFNDDEIIKDRNEYIPGWKDTKYEIARIERILDESASIYKEIWECV